MSSVLIITKHFTIIIFQRAANVYRLYTSSNMAVGKGPSRAGRARSEASWHLARKKQIIYEGTTEQYGLFYSGVQLSLPVWVLNQCGRAVEGKQGGERRSAKRRSLAGSRTFPFSQSQPLEVFFYARSPFRKVSFKYFPGSTYSAARVCQCCQQQSEVCSVAVTTISRLNVDNKATYDLYLYKFRNVMHRIALGDFHFPSLRYENCVF